MKYIVSIIVLCIFFYNCQKDLPQYSVTPDTNNDASNELLYILEGYGTNEIHLGLSPSQVQSNLQAQPEVQATGADKFTVDDITYYVYYSDSNEVKEVIIYCDHFITYRLAVTLSGIDTLLGITSDVKKEFVEGVYGPAEREKSSKLIYDSRGIVFIYDIQTFRVIGLHVFSKSDTLSGSNDKDTLTVRQGYGTQNVYIGQQRTSVESFLGSVTDEDTSVYYWYQKSSDIYGVQYNNNQVSVISIISNDLGGAMNNWSPVVFAGDTRNQIRSVFGQPTDTLASTRYIWYSYGDQGIEFMVDSSLGLSAIKVFDPGSVVPEYSWGNVGIIDTTDNDSDSYMSKYNVYFDIDIQNGSDSLEIWMDKRISSFGSWENVFKSAKMSFSGATTDDARYISASGSDHRTVDIRLTAYSNSVQELDTIIYNVMEEDSTNDISTSVSTKDWFPISENNRWVYSYYYKYSTTGISLPKTEHFGKLTREIKELIINENLIIIPIAETLLIEREIYSENSVEQYDTTFTPPILEHAIFCTLQTYIDTNGIFNYQDTCWKYFHHPDSFIPEAMFEITDTTLNFQANNYLAKKINHLCNGNSWDNHIVGENVGLMYYSNRSNPLMIGASWSLNWTLDSLYLY